MAGRFSQILIQQTTQADIDMTPMLDVVFIMLIFFIVSTSFIKETGVEVNQPTAHSAQTSPQTPWLVAIKSNGDIWMDQQPLSIQALRAHLERLSAQHPDANVIIQADTASQTGVLINVMDQIKLAGIDKISIAANVAD